MLRMAESEDPGGKELILAGRPGMGTGTPEGYCVSSPSQHTERQLGILTALILQTRTLRHREVKELCQDHTAAPCWARTQTQARASSHL